MVDFKLVGRCGLYCGACGIYRAYKDGGKYLEGVAGFFKVSPEKVRCEGCHGLTPNCWGYDCKIVLCLNTRGFEYCFECPEFESGSCEKFEDLARGNLGADVDLRANLEITKSGDVEKWLKENEERFRCRVCGKPLSSFSMKEKCYHCGAEPPK